MQGAQRGASLTQRLLAFARRQDLQVGPVNLAGLVTEMEDLLQRSVGSRIAIRGGRSGAPPARVADANQVSSPSSTWPSMARDAMPDGGTIRIEPEGSGAAGGI